MDRISIILPTYKRYDLLKECLDCIILQQSSNYSLELVAVVDDDKKSAEIIADRLDTDGLAYHIITGKKGTHHEAWNLGLRYASGNLFVHTGDDGMFRHGALELAYNAHKEKLNGYGMIAFNDLNLDGDTQIGTHVLFDRRFCIAVLGGVMVVPHYKGYWVDVEFNDRARIANRYYWCREAILEHKHSSNGKRGLQEGEVERTQFWEEDEKLYRERKAAGFPNDFPPVI